MELSVKNKLLALVLLPLIITTILINLTFYLNEVKGLEQELMTFRQQLTDTKRSELKAFLKLAHTAIDKLYKQDIAGENKNAALAILEDMRFAADGYFFIYDSNGVNVMLPTKPELVGQNLYDLKDKNGTPVTAGLIDAAKSGNGFHRYAWHKPSINGLAPKMAYTEYLPKWDWIIGTGIYIDDVNRTLEQFADKRRSKLAQDTWTSIFFAIVVLVIAGVSATFLANKGLKPLHAIVDKLKSIASGNGDLTDRLDNAGNDEIAEVAQAFNRFMDTLQPLVKQIRESALFVQSQAKELDQQASSSVQVIQSHSLETEKVVTAVTEMAATSKEVAHNTVSTAGSIDKANQQITEAQQEVDQAITGINHLVTEINTSSDAIQSLSVQTDKITGVLDVIGAIAEQTNLLALNAAIEAARAGEQGRGFAVVADEVRSLASRTQNSTEEINQMLNALHSGVSLAVSTMEASQSSGGKTVADSASVKQRLTDIDQAVVAIRNMGHQTASAAEEQSTVAEEINQNLVAIQEIVDRLSQDLHHAEQIASALSDSGTDLFSQVSQFKV